MGGRESGIAVIALTDLESCRLAALEHLGRRRQHDLSRTTTENHREWLAHRVRVGRTETTPKRRVRVDDATVGITDENGCLQMGQK